VEAQLVFLATRFCGSVGFAYVCATTNWHQEYAGILPIALGLAFVTILIVALLWMFFVHWLSRDFRSKNGLLATCAVLPCMALASYVIWDQTVPNNSCAKSHLDVNLSDRAQFRVYPEFRVRFDRYEAENKQIKVQARYSSLLKDKHALADLCRQSTSIETDQIWITGSSSAKTIAKSCRTKARGFCETIDLNVMEKLSSIKIGRDLVREGDI